MKRVKEFAFALLLVLLAFAAVNFAMMHYGDYLESLRESRVDDFPDHSEIKSLNQ